MTVTGAIEITYPVFRRMALSFLGVGLVVARVLGALVVLAAFAGGSWIVAIVVLLLVAGGPELGILIAWEMRHDQIGGPNRFAVSAAAVDVHRRSGDHHWEWADVARVRRGRYSWTVRRPGLHALMIPRAAFSAEDQSRVNDFFLAHPEFAG